ncbi:hypothetical protein BGZ76_002317, partial [Entomortierella beljakovae]
MTTPPFTVQKFKSPIDGNTVAIRVNTSDNSILWKHILKSFGNVHRVHVGDIDIHFMTNEKFEDLLPLRIEATPNLTMNVELTKDSAGDKSQKVAELPPKYDEERTHIELIRTTVLPFKSYTNDPEDSHVRFGSRVGFRHATIGCYLRSVDSKTLTTPVQYAVQGARVRGPGLQDFWQVLPACTNIDSNNMNGDMVHYGSRIRLYNVINKRFLNCRIIPTTGQSEVIAVDNNGSVDDIWVVERFENGLEYWKAGEHFILRHELTNHFLHSRTAPENKAENEIA